MRGGCSEKGFSAWTDQKGFSRPYSGTTPSLRKQQPKRWSTPFLNHPPQQLPLQRMEGSKLCNKKVERIRPQEIPPSKRCFWGLGVKKGDWVEIVVSWGLEQWAAIVGGFLEDPFSPFSCPLVSPKSKAQLQQIEILPNHVPRSEGPYFTRGEWHHMKTRTS